MTQSMSLVSAVSVSLSDKSMYKLDHTNYDMYQNMIPNKTKSDRYTYIQQ